jgi:hypothetical protein
LRRVFAPVLQPAWRGGLKDADKEGTGEEIQSDKTFIRS